MAKKPLFEPIDDETQKQYEREARLQYGPDTVNQSIKRLNGYSPAQKGAIQMEGEQIYTDLVRLMTAGMSAQDAEVQDIVVRWHDHIRYFYEPTLEVMRGLGEMYNSQPEFMATFEKIHVDLPQYLQDSITQYVDDLEYAEIVRMLQEDAVANSIR